MEVQRFGKGPPSPEERGLLELISGEPTHGDDPHVYAQAGQLHDNLEAVHLWHLQICDDQIHGARTELFKTLSAIRGLPDLIPSILKNPGKQRAHGSVILND